MGRFLAFLFGIAGAVGASQAPGFTVQYMQNLSGRVAELRPLVEEFEANISRFGYDRARAMAECETATGLLDALCSNYEVVVQRYEDLVAHRTELEAQSDYMRPVMLARTFRQDIAEDVKENFEPAVPTTTTGAVYAGGGFASFWLAFSILWAIITAPFRHREPRGKYA